MKNTLETRLGLFFALALIAAVLIMEMAGGLELFRGGYRIHALFKNVQELKIGDPVKMAGVKVGRVETIGLTNESVMVTLKLNHGTQVRTDSKATIRFASMLGGQNFVSIDFGTNGQQIMKESFIQTVEQPDMNALLAKLENVATGVENVTKSFSGDRIDNMLGPFTDFMKQNNTKLGAIFGNMQIISEGIAKGQGTLGKVLKDDTLYYSLLGTVTNFEATATDVRGMVGQASNMIGKAESIIGNVNAVLTNANETVLRINSGQGTLGKLVMDGQIYKEMTEAVENLKEILIKANRGTGSVSRLINDDSLIRNAKLTLQKLDKATEGLEDQGPLSVLGMAVNSLF